MTNGKTDMDVTDMDVTVLKAISILSTLSGDELELLRPTMSLSTIGAGEVVIQEGGPADKLYCLVNGEVQVVKHYLEPGSQVVDVLAPYNYFGEMALFGVDTPRSATVVTSEPSVFLAIEAEAFRICLMNHPQIAFTMLAETYRRLRQANELLANQTQDADI